MLKQSLCDFGDAYINVKGTITVVRQGADAGAVQGNRNNKQVIFKTPAPFTDWITEINNTQVDNAKDLDVVIPMFNSIKYSYNYSGTNLGLWQYYKDEAKNPITDSDSFKFKSRFSFNTNERGIINAVFGEFLKCYQLIAKLILLLLGQQIMSFLE